MNNFYKENMMNTQSVINFNTPLFTQVMKDYVVSNINKSNIIQANLLENINAIDVYLEKEGSHEFKLSLKTSLNAPSNPQSKNIHIQVTGEDFYVLTKDIVEKLERQIRKAH